MAPHGDIAVTDVDQNLLAALQAEAGARGAFENEGQVMMNNYHYRKHL